MNSSHDLGGLTGAETQAQQYVPGRPLRVFLVLPRTEGGQPVESDCIAAIRRYVGAVELVNSVDEARRTELAASCQFCVVIPFADSCVGSGMWEEIKTFFDRFKTEARVYEFQRLGGTLYARGESYFRTTGRILDRDETYDRIHHASLT